MKWKKLLQAFIITAVLLGLMFFTIGIPEPVPVKITVEHLGDHNELPDGFGSFEKIEEEKKENQDLGWI